MIRCLSAMIWWYGVLAISINHYVTSASWISFAVSSNYTDLRIITDANNFTPRYIPKGMSPISARLGCSQSCAVEEACHAFNFFETEGYYVCEMLPDNFCRNKVSKSIDNLSGSNTWDKLNNGTKVACLDQIFINGTTIACEKMRPGCLGNWPNCFNCTKTCIEWSQRYGNAGFRNCTLWPDGDDPTSVPILSLCNNNMHTVLKREFDLTLKKFTQDYRMSFENTNRVFSLKQYPKIQFIFKDSYGTLNYALYNLSSIDADGTLRNLSFIAGLNDIFKTNHSKLASAPFITVSNDVYGCGSFWLIEPNNATYCPGGATQMLGTPNVTLDPIVTGIREPGVNSTLIIVSAEIRLCP